MHEIIAPGITAEIVDGRIVGGVVNSRIRSTPDADVVLRQRFGPLRILSAREIKGVIFFRAIPQEAQSATA